ncbi:hypothetical protein BH23VER1_BH23VER1_01340 [soil metagenome]
MKNLVIMFVTGLWVLGVAGVAEGNGDGGRTVETTTGKVYVEAKVLKVDPDGMTFAHLEGIAKVGFDELPVAIQEEFGYDREKAKKFIDKHREVVKPAQPSPRMVAVSQQMVGANIPVNFYPYGGGGYYGAAVHGGFDPRIHHRAFRRTHGRNQNTDFQFFMRPGSPVPPPVTVTKPIMPQPRIVPRNFSPPARSLPRVNQTLRLNR